MVTVEASLCCGITRVEVGITLLIIVAAGSLILSAMQQARESARQAQCENILKQTAIQELVLPNLPQQM
ncbi:DUF1559 domain-containing protein [Aeoliella sp. ICT_H6.2]|uniref:DUF1559 domain-containing protein n=1 Tax=Aeoliella straminimaris TaxID=2954799 RepID=A0A9X2JJC3_9BACT|nr:DUF1559 domain-containing protein [Aeoliella straminimaris]MCO6047711.1 DUF1559 domain-containing protein [Aeoliella straminimaris]